MIIDANYELAEMFIHVEDTESYKDVLRCLDDYTVDNPAHLYLWMWKAYTLAF